jgi:hypothetical protein
MYKSLGGGREERGGQEPIRGITLLEISKQSMKLFTKNHFNNVPLFKKLWDIIFFGGTITL